MAYKNVAIAGATGTLGSVVLQVLAESGKFNITVLTRAGSSTTPASTPQTNVKFVAVDYSDRSSLTTALHGIEAVISTLPHMAAAQQQALLDASVDAGVHRYIPSEFGSDTLNPAAAKLPLFASKIALQKSLAALASEDKISYTLVMSGPFLDFGLSNGFLGLDFKAKRATYLDGGSALFSATTRSAVGTALVGVLVHPDQTRNRAVYVQSAALSQRDYVTIASQYSAKQQWTEVDGGTTAEIEQKSYTDLATGKRDMGVFIGFLFSAIYRDGYGGRFDPQKLDNELLGVKQLSREEIGVVVGEIAAAAERS